MPTILVGSRPLLSRIALVAIAAAAGLPVAAAADPTVPFVARVGDVTIGRPQLEAALLRGNVPALPAGPQRQQAEAATLEKLVDEVLLQAVVDREGIQVDPAAVDASIAQLDKQIKARGGTFGAFLEMTHRTEAEFRGQATLELAVRQLVARRVTPQAVEAYFEKHRRELDGTLIRASHVVLRPDLGRGDVAVDECLARAAVLRGRILQGEITFAEAARAHSAGPSRRRGGDVGYMPRNSMAHEEFAKQAFAISKGDISKPFVTPSGVHIMQVTDVQEGTKTLAGMRPQIEQTLAQEAVRDMLAAARQTTTIEYAPGVAHFDPATPAAGTAPRRVLVEPETADR
jgi:peptidyl-prolyl cis-trans isomerase SurA